jgi:hypothetical protein
MTKLVDIEGIGPVYAAKLQEAGVGSAEALLDQGATPKARKEMAEKSGISDGLILEWVNHVDLYRIRGVGSNMPISWRSRWDTVPGWLSASRRNLLEDDRERSEEAGTPFARLSQAELGSRLKGTKSDLLDKKEFVCSRVSDCPERQRPNRSG